MVFPLPEGTFTVNTSKKFIPFDEFKDDLKNRSGSLVVDIIPFLIKTDRDLIILDPGLGMQLPNGEFSIHENIRRAGFTADQVGTVLLSHLHKDHVGGICYGNGTAFNLMFPNAKYYCQQKEMEYALTKTTSPSFEADKLDFLSHSPNLKYINGNGKIGDDIQYEISGGHTPFHQVFQVKTREGIFFFGGDVLPQPQQLQVKYIAKYDYDGKVASEKRIEYGTRAASENWTCLFFHSGKMPMGKVMIDDEGKFLLQKV